MDRIDQLIGQVKQIGDDLEVLKPQVDKFVQDISSKIDQVQAGRVDVAALPAVILRTAAAAGITRGELRSGFPIARIDAAFEAHPDIPTRDRFEFKNACMAHRLIAGSSMSAASAKCNNGEQYETAMLSLASRAGFTAAEVQSGVFLSKLDAGIRASSLSASEAIELKGKLRRYRLLKDDSALSGT